MKRLKLIISVFLILLTTQMQVLAAPRIPVYKVGNVLYFLDKASGTITGFAGEPKDITIPLSLGGYNVVSIGSRAFAGSPTLSTVSIPEGITTVSAEAFASCPNLSSVEIGSTVSYIGSKAFANCQNLSYVSFKGLPEYIESDAFDNTNWIVDSSAEFLMLGNTTLLQYNGNAETVIIPDGVKNIAANAFAYNETVKEILLPDTMEKIGDNAFVHCPNLERITIPKTVSHIGAGAFDDTQWLQSQEGDFVTVNGILISYKGNDAHVRIPEGITAIGSGAFMANESLRSVYIPDTAIYIDSMAFGGCSEFVLINIPESVEWIDEYAFASCTRLTIQGAHGSYAHSYAQYMEMPFSTEVYVSYNGEKIYFDKAAPVIRDDRTYVPLRALMELMDYTVIWEEKTGDITCTKDSRTVIITPTGEITIDGDISSYEAHPINVNGSNLVPARFIAEAVDADVKWNEELRTVEISYK